MPRYEVVALATVNGKIIQFGPVRNDWLTQWLERPAPGDLVNALDEEITRRYGKSATRREFSVREISS